MSGSGQSDPPRDVAGEDEAIEASEGLVHIVAACQRPSSGSGNGAASSASGAEPGRGGQATGTVEDLVTQVLGRPLTARERVLPLAAAGLDSLRAAQLQAELDNRGVHVELRSLLTGLSLDDLLSVPMGDPAGAPPVTSRGSRYRASDSNAAGVPLSDAERAMHDLDRRSAPDAMNAVSAVLEIRGASSCRIRAAIRVLARRHPVLRTRIAETVNGPVKILSERPDIRVVDVADWEPDDIAGERNRLAAARVDLESGAGIRVHLFDDGRGCISAVLRAHHLFIDLTSVGVLLDEVVGSPAAASTMDGDEIPASPDGEARDRGYWAGELAGAPTVLRVPDDLQRPSRPSNRGVRISSSISGAQIRRMTAHATALGSTLPQYLLAAFGLALHRRSGQDDLLIGHLYAARSRTDRGVVGYRANLLPVRLRLRPDDTVGAYVTRSATVATAAVQHGRLPFAQIARTCDIETRPDRSPLCQAIFTYQQCPSTLIAPILGSAEPVEINVGSARIRMLPQPTVFLPADLALEAVPQPDGSVILHLDHRADVHTPTTAAALLSETLRALQAPEASPARRASAPGADAAVAILDRSRGPDHQPSGVALHSAFFDTAAIGGELPAVIDGEREINYRRLAALASRLAADLAGRGVGAGSLVGVCAGRGIPAIAGYLAALRAGAAFMPLDPDVPVERLRDICRRMGDVPLLASSDAAQLAETICAEPPIVIPGADDLRRTDLIDRPAGRRPAPLPANCWAGPGSLAYVMHTSGSTGVPKAVGVPHRGITNVLNDFAGRGSLRAGARHGWICGVGFDVSVYEIFSALSTAGTVLIAPPAARVNGVDLAEWVVRGDIDAVFIPPFALSTAVRTFERIGVGRLRKVLLGVEPVPSDLAGALARTEPHMVVTNAYGPTETTVMCTATTVTGADSGTDPVPIGAPVPNTRCYVLDADGRLQVDGAVGEVHVGGDQLAWGYLNDPRASALSMLPDPFAGRPGSRMYRTGDLARRGVDGRLQFHGRRDQQVKMHGRRIELGEVRTALLACEGIADALPLVVGTGDRQQIVGYVVIDAAADATDLVRRTRARLAGRLPRHLIPGRIVPLDGWPLTSNGKIDHAQLEATSLTPPTIDPRPAAGQDEYTAGVIAVAAELLGLERLDPDDDLFARGANSLLIAQLLQQLRSRFGLAIPAAAVYRTPTVSSLIALATPADESPIRRRDRAFDVVVTE